uniref:Transmembrane protein 211 n=1 Tax=Meleagris gallopavo TaxID=9103 RepID=A0A803Y9H7_MELGA
MASGLLVYPFGFNSATVKRFCENSDIYYAGDCQIGWGYMLAIVGVMLSSGLGSRIPCSDSSPSTKAFSQRERKEERRLIASSPSLCLSTHPRTENS